MPLKSLHELVEKLRERVHLHSDVLRKSEMLTRYVLIDPLLRELGWDTEDPELVRPEFRSGSGFADYALLSAGKPLVMLEAKKLDKPLKDGLMQSIQYCLEDGTPYFAVTDGRRWEVYETHKVVPIDQKRVVAFDLVGQKPAEVVINALSLWRYKLAEAGTLDFVKAPLISLQDEGPNVPASISSPATYTPVSSSASTDWLPISSVNPKPHDKAPLSLRLPDRTEVSVGSWVNLVLGITNWLVESGVLTAANCPIRRASKNLVHSSPTHPDGSLFTNSKTIGPLYLEAHYNADGQHKNAVAILKHCGQNVDDFLVKL